MGHERRATLDYARARGVELWSLDPVHPLWETCDPAFADLVARAVARDFPAHYADVGGGRVLLVVLPQGPEAARQRFPRLEFLPLRDPAVRQDLRRWDSFARQTRQNGNGTAEKGEGVGNGVKANRRRRGR